MRRENKILSAKQVRYFNTVYGSAPILGGIEFFAHFIRSMPTQPRKDFGYIKTAGGFDCDQHGRVLTMSFYW